LPFFEQGFAAAGVPPERVQPMTTFIYAAIRGLQLDLLATGERARIDAAFPELLRMLSQPSSSGAVGGSRPIVDTKSRKSAVLLASEKRAQVIIVGGRVSAKRVELSATGGKAGPIAHII
jgi:hypothetical protein